MPRGSPPLPQPAPAPADYTPFDNRTHFELADFFYRRVEISQSALDELMHLWAATLPEGEQPPFADHDDLHNAIDAIPHGEIPWQSFAVSYGGPKPESGNIPPWMDAEYIVWFRCPREVARQQLCTLYSISE